MTALLALATLSLAHAQDEDIGNLLDSIPDIEQKEVEVDPANQQRAEDEADFGTANPTAYTSSVRTARLNRLLRVRFAASRGL